MLPAHNGFLEQNWRQYESYGSYVLLLEPLWKLKGFCDPFPCLESRNNSPNGSNDVRTLAKIFSCQCQRISSN